MILKKYTQGFFKDNNLIEYSLDNNTLLYQLIIIHIYPVIDTSIDSLLYYITNSDGDRLICQRPNLVNTTKVGDDLYISVFTIDIIEEFLTIGKINLILPFDHSRSILNLEMFSLFSGNILP